MNITYEAYKAQQRFLLDLLLSGRLSFAQWIKITIKIEDLYARRPR